MDVPLSELGVAQAQALASWFRRGPRPDIVFSSPYRRAHDTAAVALDGADLDVAIVADERLREREFGILAA